METRTLEATRAYLKSIYSSEKFARDGHLIIEKLATYLRETARGGKGSLDWVSPEIMLPRAAQFLEQGKTRAVETQGELEPLIDAFLSQTHRLHAPRYLGHQVAPPIPLAPLFETLGSVTNQGCGIYEMSPFAVAAETAVIEGLGEQIGWKKGRFGGLATHGGSLSTLTALLVARNLRYGDAWEKGMDVGRVRPAMLTSLDSHYSVARSAGLLGIGTKSVLKVPVDSKRRMTADSARKVVERARGEGFDPFVIVATSGTTAVGAFDPLEELADLCAEAGLWLHVDGCHGASLLFSRKHREKVRGIDRCDSVAWDAHKMLFIPALSTFLLFKDKAHSYAAFRQDAPYLFDPEAPALSAYDPAIRTLECTKRSLAMGLWAAWSIYGPGLFESLVDVTLETTRRFYERLKETDDFIPVHEPEANILCFRYVPNALQKAASEKISNVQQTLRRRLVESGQFYITSTRLDGVMALRVTVINPFTAETEWEDLLATLRKLGDDLIQAS